MRLRGRNLGWHLGTSMGRARLRRLLFSQGTWPFLRPAAALHRRLVARRARIVVVVGSLGKTTTTAAVRAALGGPLPRQSSNAFSWIAAAMLRIRPWTRHAVLEIGINAKGQMRQYAAMVRPDVVVVTAIASEHNRSLGSLDDTLAEKAQILRGLRPGGLVVLNGDDARVRGMAALTDARVLTFGFGPDNDVRASAASLEWPHGIRIRLHVGGATHEVRVRLLGRIMAYPVLAAVAVAWAEGRPLAEVVPALEAMPPRPGRLQLVDLPGGAWLIRDDYKGTLESIDAALDVLAEAPGRRIAVLGDVSEPPGSQGPHYQRLGARLAGIASRVVVVGSGKSVQRYASGATRTGLPRAAVSRARSVQEAAEAVRADLRPGDVVLVKGRDTQRLERVALALQGRTVGCALDSCRLRPRCESCAVLERAGIGLAAAAAPHGVAAGVPRR